MSSYKPTYSHEEKNVFKSTTNKPLRFAVLGPHKSSKSAFVSIIANQISLENYYPTLRNSPILLQFQPKRETSRALLDVNVSLSDLKELDLLENTQLNISKPLLSQINADNIRLLKKLHESHLNSPQSQKQYLLSLESTDSVVARTKHYYDLDYSNPDLFNDESFSPINLFHSPIASFSTGRSFGNSFNNSVGREFPTMSNLNDEFDGKTQENDKKYRAPITTPILIELIDTPGVQKEDLIPFLERSLDNRLSRDVLSNLANEYNTNYRSRVKPLITGSGISELNAAVDGYLIFYSCVPEFDNTDVLPPTPMYDDKDEVKPISINIDGKNFNKDDDIGYNKNITTNNYNKLMSKGTENDGFEAIEILKSLHVSIVDAWKEYNSYHRSWQVGKEYDQLSITSSFKQLWKNKDLKDGKDGKLSKSANSNSKNGKDNNNNSKEKSSNCPPVTVVCTHIDSPYAAPVLIERGRELANEWGCSFVQMSCAYDMETWTNVEEALALLVRESVISKKQ